MTILQELAFPKLKRKDYEARLKALQMRLMVYQRGLFLQGKRAVVVCEGADTAGKGGAIKRMVELMDPRGFRVYPVGPPTPEELARHYLQRFWLHIPKAGQLAIFDRSWYGRVLVERVEHLAKPEVWGRAYRELNEFERQMGDDGVILIKLFYHISLDEQRKRLRERLQRPEKRWKLTLSDLENHALWDDYQLAFEDMLVQTSTNYAPWTVVPANDKKYSRVLTLETVCEVLDRHVDASAVEVLDPAVERRAKALFGED